MPPSGLCPECVREERDQLRAENVMLYTRAEELKAEVERLKGQVAYEQERNRNNVACAELQNGTLRGALVECVNTLENEWQKHKRDNGCTGEGGDCGVKVALDQGKAALKGVIE